MSHVDILLNTHDVNDTDASFIVDPLTREISTRSSKNILMQGDHNSERFTFKMPRYIEKHDMALCNVVQIYYLNVDGKTKKSNTGIYTVDDLKIVPFFNDTLSFSWLISSNATEHAGGLSFMLRFACMDGSTINYAWNTNVYGDIRVVSSLNSDEVFETEYVDVIQQWKDSVMAELNVYVDVAVKEHVNVKQIQVNEKNIAINENNIATLNSKLNNSVATITEDINTSVRTLVNSNDILSSRMDTFAKLNEGSTTGDAELIDIRIGANGANYSSAGEAVRDQIDFLNKNNRLSLDFIDDVYIHHSTGLEESISQYSSSDYIDIRHGNFLYGIHLVLYIGDSAGFALYDKNKKLVKGYSSGITGSGKYETTLYTYTIPENARYLRISTLKSKKHATHVGWLYKDTAFTLPTIATQNLANYSVTPIKTNFVTHYKKSNYINKNQLVKNTFFDGVSGEFKSYTGYYCTDYIPLEQNTEYYYDGIYKGYCGFFDKDFNFIHGIGLVSSSGDPNGNSLSNPFTIPDGAVYGIFTITERQDPNAAWIYTENEEPREYIYHIKCIADGLVDEPSPTEYTGDDICTFTKGVCIGDSLTAGAMNYYDNGDIYNFISYDKYSFPRILERMTGIEISNMGIGGKSSAEWYEENKNVELSGYDFAIVQLGVNDYYCYNGWTDTSVNAFKSIITKLKNENNNIKIFVSTIIPAASYSNAGFDAISEGIRSVVDDLNDKNVILVDLAKYGHTNDDEAYNRGHLSAYGYWQLAKDYKSYISYYMNTHKDEFSEIQFIGTEYRYSTT